MKKRNYQELLQIYLDRTASQPEEQHSVLLSGHAGPKTPTQ